MKSKKFMNRGIKSKIILAIVACSTITTLLVGIVSISNSSKIIEQGAQQNISLIAQNKAQEFNGIISNVENSVEDLSAAINFTLDKETFSKGTDSIKSSERSIAKLVKGFGEKSDEVMSVYFYMNPELAKGLYGAWYADEKNDRTFTEQPLGSLDEFTPDNEDMEWYYKPVNAKKAQWLDPYVDPDLNISMISYVVPVYEDGILLGVAGMDINFEIFQKAVKSTNIYDTGNVALVNQNYDFLVPPTNKPKSNIGFFEKIKSRFIKDEKQKVDTTAQASVSGDNGNFAKMNNGELKYLTERIDKNNSGTFKYTYENLDKIMAYAHLSNGYIMLVDVPQNEVLREMNSVILKAILIILLGIIMAAAVAGFVGGVIANPILKVTKLVDKTAKLDLTDDNSFEGLTKRKDEVGLIALSVGNMRRLLRDTVQEIIQGASQIAAHSNNLADAMNETEMSMSEIAKTTNDLASGATQQASVAQEGLSKLMYLTNEIRNVASSSDSVKGFIHETDRVNKQTLEAVENLQYQFKNNNDITQEISESIDELAVRSESISNIVTTIKAIAKQTNLLALNAAIEAARAGEAGRGFAIVAEEVRKLAEQTSESTADIENMIEGIQKDINNTKGKMGSANRIVEESNRALSVTNQSFEVIDEAMINTFHQINSLIESIEKMDSGKNDVVSSIEEISSITEESVAATEEVSSTVENQSMTTNEISRTTENLKDIALNLEKLIGKFKID